MIAAASSSSSRVADTLDAWASAADFRPRSRIGRQVVSPANHRAAASGKGRAAKHKHLNRPPVMAQRNDNSAGVRPPPPPSRNSSKSNAPRERRSRPLGSFSPAHLPVFQGFFFPDSLSLFTHDPKVYSSAVRSNYLSSLCCASSVKESGLRKSDLREREYFKERVKEKNNLFIYLTY